MFLGLAGGAFLGISAELLSDGDPVLHERMLWIADNLANPMGQIFLRILFMVVVPIVFSSIALGVASLGSVGSLGRIGVPTLLWFIGTTALAGSIGILLVNVFEPGRGLDPEQTALIKAEFLQAAHDKIRLANEGTGFSIHTFVNIIPKNAVRSAADDRETLGVIFFALAVGIASSYIARDRAKAFLELVQALYDICVVILRFAMKLAPMGVMGLMFSVAAKLGVDVLLALGRYVLVALGGLVAYQVLVLGALSWLFVKISPRAFFSRTRGLMLTAFSTSSSNATLPTSLRVAVEEFGVPPHIAGFVLPLGATMNMNGTALFEGVSVLFLAQVAGVELSLSAQAVVIVLAVLTAIGAAGVPGGSLPLLALVLSQVGVPPDLLAVILGSAEGPQPLSKQL